MNHDPLDKMLGDYARRPLPGCPDGVSVDVWREIERRRNESLIARLGWSELLQRPAWALAGLAFALAMGAVPAFAFSRIQQAKQLARDSLHLGMFSPHAPGQPANVLARPDQSNVQRPLQ